MAPKPNPLPAALAERAAKKAADAKANLLARARADLALVLRRKAEITEAFYDIGEALVRLREDPIPRLLGYASFGALCAEELGLSLTRASKLVAIAARVPRELAIGWGQEKSAALVSLADATKDPTDVPAHVDLAELRKAVKKSVDLDHASANEIKALATSLRKERRSASARGRTTTPAERKTATAIERRLRASGAEAARVKAIATKPGQVSALRIEGVPLDRLPALRKALAGV